MKYYYLRLKSSGKYFSDWVYNHPTPEKFFVPKFSHDDALKFTMISIKSIIRWFLKFCSTNYLDDFELICTSHSKIKKDKLDLKLKNIILIAEEEYIIERLKNV